MPTYEYLCPDCGHRFDIWQEVGSPAPPCENCQSQTKKVFQPPRVIFKGSGFYLTDLRSEQAAKSGKNGESKSESSGEKSESNTSESAKSDSAKTESKSEAKSSDSGSKSDASSTKSDAK